MCAFIRIASFDWHSGTLYQLVGSVVKGSGYGEQQREHWFRSSKPRTKLLLSGGTPTIGMALFCVVLDIFTVKNL